MDSGSSVTAMLNSFYRTLIQAGAPLAVLGPTARKLRSANGTRIGVSGCSHCVVSFLGLQVEFPVLVCDLATGTDAIIGTDAIGSVLPHTLDIKNCLLLTEGGLLSNCTDGALSGRVFTVGHCSVPPYSEAVLHCSVRTTGVRRMPPSGLLEGLTLFAENTGLIVGRTLVDPSRWKVPVLVSNFSQDTVVVAPFSEVGIIAQVSAIQSITERLRSYGLQLKSIKCHLFRSSIPFLGHIVGRRGLECDPTKIEDVKSWPVPDCLKSVRQFLGFVGYYRRFIPKFADVATPLVALTGKDVPFMWDVSCSSAFGVLRESLIHAPILAFPTETGQYIRDTDASKYGLGGVLSQIQDDVERIVAYCSSALRPSQRCYCTTKREMLAAVAMCIQFRSCLRGAKFNLRMDHISLVWLHQFKDTEGMMAQWLHALQQFHFSIIHRPGDDHGKADGLSRAPASPCRQCTRPDCPLVVSLPVSTDQPFDSESTGSSEDADLVPIHSGEDWVAQLDCITLHTWISSGEFPS